MLIALGLRRGIMVIYTVHFISKTRGRVEKLQLVEET